MDRQCDPPPDWKTDKTTNAGKKPGRILEVSPELGRSFQYFEVKRVVRVWKFELDCDVEPRFQNGRLIRFEIFGPSANLDATYRDVKKWIDWSVTKTTASASWAKMPAWENRKWTEDKLRQEVKERKQVFRGPPPEDLSYKVCISFPILDICTIVLKSHRSRWHGHRSSYMPLVSTPAMFSAINLSL
jgi:hypothetical protein